MPRYRIVSENDPRAERRMPRGSQPDYENARLVTAVEAGSLAEAASDARDTQPHSGRRIVSIEELHPGFAYSDEEISRALAAISDPDDDDIPILDRDQFALKTRCPTTDDEHFDEIVENVAYALRESYLVPGLDISVLRLETEESFAMVEVLDRARHLYLSHGTAIRNLSDDWTATGWDGVLAIARRMITFANDLH